MRNILESIFITITVYISLFLLIFGMGFLLFYETGFVKLSIATLIALTPVIIPTFLVRFYILQKSKEDASYSSSLEKENILKSPMSTFLICVTIFIITPAIIFKMYVYFGITGGLISILSIFLVSYYIYIIRKKNISTPLTTDKATAENQLIVINTEQKIHLKTMVITTAITITILLLSIPLCTFIEECHFWHIDLISNHIRFIISIIILTNAYAVMYWPRTNYNNKNNQQS